MSARLSLPRPSEFRTAPAEKMLCVQLIFWLGVAASVSIGLGNAGNDLCNAMGVTVGARVLPLWKAVVLGARTSTGSGEQSTIAPPSDQTTPPN